MRFFWLLFLLPLAACFAQTPAVVGDYTGAIGALRLSLHVKADASGALQGSVDSVDQGAMGLPCSNFKLSGKDFGFDVPSVGGSWQGTVSDDGATLTGNRTQGSRTPLEFHRDSANATPAVESKVDGIWLGTLEAGGQKLRIQLHVRSESGGKEVCSLDSLDQGAMGLPCENAKLDGAKFSFEVPAVKGTWTGTISDSGKELNGMWSQGRSLALNMTRQAAAAPPAVHPPKYEDAKAPVTLDGLKEVLDADLAAELKSGNLSPESGGGTVIGVVQHGRRAVLAYGPVKEDSIFEIGSITKTFTGLILARMAARQQVKLNEPVRELLPPGTVPKPAGAEITLLDLATQHSGLPRMPDNFAPKNPRDPYADYSAANLYEFIAKHGLAKPDNTQFLYSNLGFGLLGQALANRSGLSYADLLKKEVTGPLHMNDTEITLSPDQAGRFAQGHDGQHHAAGGWILNAMSGAGAIRSTAGDMLTYLEAQIHPDKTSLTDAIQMTHELRAEAGPTMKIGLAWLHEEKTGCTWHNGATGGYSAYATFCPDKDYGVIVLYNTTVSPSGSFADRLGEHVSERLGGRPILVLQ